MKLTSHQITLLWKWLDIPLHGEDCRQRNQFVKEIKDYKDSAEERRKELLEDAANKDEKGQAIIKEGKYDIPPEKYLEFAKNYNDYLLGETEIGQIDKKLWRWVKSILTRPDTAPKLGIEYGAYYDDLLSRIEAECGIISPFTSLNKK